MNPIFSIIIPVYNVAPYLRECLDSVLAQTYSDWEAICVDDGSTDGCGSILDEYAEKDSRFVVVHKKNEGVSVARNTAIGRIRGQWFLYLDGDDELCPDALEKLQKVISSNDCDGILFSPIEVFLSEENKGRVTDEWEVVPEIRGGTDLLIGDFFAHGYPFARIYRTDKFRHLRFPAGVKMMEDLIYWADAIGVKSKWIGVRGNYYLYRFREVSASRANTLVFYREVVDAVSYALAKLREYGAGEAGVRKYWRMYQCGSGELLAQMLWTCGAFDFERMRVADVLHERMVEALGFNGFGRRQRILWMAARYRCLGPIRFLLRVAIRVKSVLGRCNRMIVRM